MTDATRTVLLIIIAVAVVVIFVPLLVASTMMGGMMGWGGWVSPAWNPRMWWVIGMMIFMLVFWGAAIAGIFLLIRWTVQRNRPIPRPPADMALDILRRRYAAGEISREEFEERRRDLVSRRE